MSGYNREQIEAMLAKYGDMVYRMAIIQVKKQDLAEDIYQTVWLRLLQQKKAIEPEEHLKAWLLRTTINCCKDYWKSAWIQRICSRDTERMEERIEETPEAEGAGGFLTECVQGLPEKYRTIIHLYYYEDYKCKEIAKILGISENTVISRLARGREKLKKLLEEEEKYEF